VSIHGCVFTEIDNAYDSYKANILIRKLEESANRRLEHASNDKNKVITIGTINYIIYSNIQKELARRALGIVQSEYSLLPKGKLDGSSIMSDDNLTRLTDFLINDRDLIDLNDGKNNEAIRSSGEIKASFTKSIDLYNSNSIEFYGVNLNELKEASNKLRKVPFETLMEAFIKCRKSFVFEDGVFIKEMCDDVIDISDTAIGINDEKAENIEGTINTANGNNAIVDRTAKNGEDDTKKEVCDFRSTGHDIAKQYIIQALKNEKIKQDRRERIEREDRDR